FFLLIVFRRQEVLQSVGGQKLVVILAIRNFAGLLINKFGDAHNVFAWLDRLEGRAVEVEFALLVRDGGAAPYSVEYDAGVAYRLAVEQDLSFDTRPNRARAASQSAEQTKDRHESREISHGHLSRRSDSRLPVLLIGDGDSFAALRSCQGVERGIVNAISYAPHCSVAIDKIRDAGMPAAEAPRVLTVIVSAART